MAVPLKQPVLEGPGTLEKLRRRAAFDPEPSQVGAQKFAEKSASR